MTEPIEVTLFNSAQAAEDKFDFYATILGIVSAFSQEHIGTETLEQCSKILPKA